MATLMEKESLISALAYPSSIVLLRLEEDSAEFQENLDLLSNKRNYFYDTLPEEIRFKHEAAEIKALIAKYEHLPILPNYQQ